MPIFEYECIICGNIEERILSKPQQAIACAKCGHTSLKIMSAAHVKVNGYNAINGYSSNQGLHNNKKLKQDLEEMM